MPKRLRERLQLRASTRLHVSVDGLGRLVLTPARIEPAELFAGRPRIDEALSLTAIDAAIRRGAVE